ncbi:hypothetical protein [Thiolapillus sp.]|uniref:hypothetical protein n=1 Tax=Thiolapillus sp. TaxID=2017437 RepID=UPI003AF8C13F
MTRTAGARIGCQRPSRFWGLGCPKIYHEVEDTLVLPKHGTRWRCPNWPTTNLLARKNSWNTGCLNVK